MEYLFILKIRRCILTLMSQKHSIILTNIPNMLIQYQISSLQRTITLGCLQMNLKNNIIKLFAVIVWTVLLVWPIDFSVIALLLQPHQENQKHFMIVLDWITLTSIFLQLLYLVISWKLQALMLRVIPKLNN